MTIVRVVDIETSGLPEEEQHAICEIGWVDVNVETLTIRNPTRYFVNPGHPMRPHIRAIHHISDAMVVDAMPPDQAVALLLKDLGPNDVLAAHLAAFETQFINAGERPWICTWKVSLRAWPELVSHSNQALRYELGVDADPDFDPADATPPHRALPDAIVTAFILRKQLGLRPLDRLIEISSEPGFLYWCPGQKHKGKTFKEVAIADPAYLRWIADKSEMGESEKFTAKHWLGKVGAP
jgi:exodeoxyribonuclease X